MGKELQDGLILDKIFTISDEKKPGLYLHGRIIQILVILLGYWSSVSVLRDSVDITVDMLLVNTVLLICIGITYLLFLIPAYNVVKLFFMILFYGLFFYSRLPRILNGFYHIENLVIDRLVISYNYSGYYYKADMNTREEDIILLLIMVLIPIMVLFTISIVRSRLVNLSSVILFLPVVASLILVEIPSEKYLISIVLVELYLLRSGFTLRHAKNGSWQRILHRINSRVAVWLSLMGLLLFLAIKIIVPKEEYADIYQIKEMKSEMQSAITDFSLEDFTSKFTNIKLFQYTGASGGLAGGKLGKVGEVIYTDSEQLIVTAPYTAIQNGMYLKGYVGCEYTGDSWKGHTTQDRAKFIELMNSIPTQSFHPVNQTNQMLSIMANLSSSHNDEIAYGELMISSYMQLYTFYMGKLDVEYKNANGKFLYAPYYTDYNQLNEIYYEQDLYAAPTIYKENYEYNFYYNYSLDYLNESVSLMETAKEYTDYEKLYQQYVYDVYTKLPKEGLDQLKQDFTPEKTGLNSAGIKRKISYVKEYLDDNTEYTLAPGELPQGKDFVEYFLYENKKGYCAHYASAATLMLRSLGVPARYVEGYAINSENSLQSIIDSTQEITTYINGYSGYVITPESKITVTDRSAHAWVEVYMDGCGWIPVEFTPVAPVVFDSSQLSNFINSNRYLTGNEEDNTKPEPTEAVQKPSPTVTNPIKENVTKQPEQQKDSNKSSEIEKEQQKIGSPIIAVMVLFIIIIVLFLVMIANQKRKRKWMTNRNKKALYLYSEIEIILSYCFLPKRKAQLEDYETYVSKYSPYAATKRFDECMMIIKKARFGKDLITTTELKIIEELRRNLYHEVYQELSFGKRIHLKILLLM